MTFSAELYNYLRKHKRIYPPYVWNKFGVSPQEFSLALVAIWERFTNIGIYDNYLTTNIPTEDWVYEVCNTKYDRGNYVSARHLEKWCVSNQKRDQHHSIVAHDKVWRKHVTETGTTGRVRDSRVKVDYLYIELDRKYTPNPLEKAAQDAFIIQQQPYIQNNSMAFYSGNASIHLLVHAGLFGNPIGKQKTICGRGNLLYNLQVLLAGDVRHNNGLTDVWNEEETMISLYYELLTGKTNPDLQAMKQHLENCDPNICSVNSLIRSPLSYHEKTGKQKLVVNDIELLSGEFPKKQTTLSLPRKAKPYLLHLYYEAIEPTAPKRKFIDIKDNSIIISTFAKHIPYFDPSLANDEGYVNGLWSPFYKDGNPSVGVNINTGFYKDFGNADDTMDFIAFYARVENITYEEAKHKLI